MDRATDFVTVEGYKQIERKKEFLEFVDLNGSLKEAENFLDFAKKQLGQKRK